MIIDSKCSVCMDKNLTALQIANAIINTIKDKLPGFSRRPQTILAMIKQRVAEKIYPIPTASKLWFIIDTLLKINHFGSTFNPIRLYKNFNYH